MSEEKSQRAEGKVFICWIMRAPAAAGDSDPEKEPASRTLGRSASKDSLKGGTMRPWWGLLRRIRAKR